MQRPSRSHTGDVLRHRHRFMGWRRQADRSGLWLRVTWLWWTWDHMPPRVGKQIVDQVNWMRLGGNTGG